MSARRILFSNMNEEPSSKRPRIDMPTDIEIDEFEYPLAICEDEVVDNDNVIARALDRQNLRKNSKVVKLPPDEPHFSITTFSGQKVFVKPVSASFQQELVKDHGMLLGTPFSDLMTEAESLTFTSQSCQSDFSITNEKPSSLWTDTYSCRGYMDLLSEEHLNRQLLHWIKLWDYLVYDKPIPINNRNMPSKLPTRRAVNNFKKQLKDQENTSELDGLKRPKQRIVLLCGPPGQGKTTLAHIVCRHAGYRVVEVNASDERSVEGFSRTLEAITHSTGVSDNRPCALIIDEIDGAPVAAINVLLNHCYPSKKKAKLVKRPIICIANNQYAPSLRQIRRVGLVLSFTAVSTSVLAQRLHKICQKQDIICDRSALYSLCEKSNNDIRSCLNTLQFIKSQTSSGSTHLTVKSINNSSLGIKDTEIGFIEMCNKVLQIPRKVPTIFDPNETSVFNRNPEVSATRFNTLLTSITSFDDQERLICALHENYLRQKIRGNSIDVASYVAEWFSRYDIMHRCIFEKQWFYLFAYNPILPLAVHYTCAVTSRPKFVYPTAEFDNRNLRQKSENILQSFLDETSTNLQMRYPIKVALLDVLPLLRIVLKPHLRPVNNQLYSIEEKEELCNVVSLFLSFGISYRLESNSSDSSHSYVLEPDIEQLVVFPGIDHPPQLASTVNTLIREIHTERMRKSGSLQDSAKKPTQSSKKAVPNVVKSKPALDFFGRAVEKSKIKDVVKKKKTGLLVDVSNIWFKYSEGYSNAIRRTVKVKEFF